MKVVKRDESIQDFNFEKINDVLAKAFSSVNQEIPEKFIEQLKETFDKYFTKKDTISVEEIQDIIQKEFIKRNKYEVAESFILYRNRHAEIRENKSDLIKQIQAKLNGTNIENQNANLDEMSFGGRIGEAARIVTKNAALKNVMSKMARKNHENNIIYVHDLDSYAAGMHNCLTVPIDDLLKNGFNTRQTDVRGANSVNTAMQLVAVLFQIQSLQQFGGVAASHIDHSMVPYVRKSFWKHYIDGLRFIKNLNDKEIEKLTTSELLKDCFISELPIDSPRYKKYEKVYNYALKMTERETYQAVEGLFHNLNTLQSRSGNQLPFSSINFGTCTEVGGRMITKAILDVCIKGLGKHGITSIFPCLIFQYMKGVNDAPGTPNYDLYRLALKSTAQRIYPNYCNVDWSVNAGYDRNDPETYMSTMGCRTYNGVDINAEPGVNPQKKDGRGNLAPVTIILPTVAMIAKEKCEKTGTDIIETFMKLLDTKINEAKDMLLERFNHMCKQPMESAKFMYENLTMRGYKKEEGIISALKHGTLVIGQLGLAETLQILVGCDHTSEEGMNLAKEIESLFNTRCKEFKSNLKLNFGVYYTPAENLCYTAMKNFTKKYGVIPNVSDHEYFTNSMHVPVWHNMNPFEKIDIESQLTGYSNAGCITYVELPSSAKNNIDALEQLVKYAMDKDIPYFAINVPIDYCPNCGYEDEIPGDECPKCGGTNIKRLRRVCGYLTGDYKSAFNYGKQCEVKDRVKHIQG